MKRLGSCVLDLYCILFGTQKIAPGETDGNFYFSINEILEPISSAASSSVDVASPLSVRLGA